MPDPRMPPSIDDARPVEEGGPIARSGFGYQDLIAVGFLIEMLEDPSILKVHCETHDDIVVVRAVDGSTRRVAEYIQVKSGELDHLWSVAELCRRKDARAGTSIFEISLSRDQFLEAGRFRIVTRQPVNDDLKVLTYPLHAASRQMPSEELERLRVSIDSRCAGHASANGNDSAYWLKNCVWDQRYGDTEVRKDLVLRLIRLGTRDGRLLLPEFAEELVEGLRAIARAAGDARWDPNPTDKMIFRAKLLEWWDRRTREIIDGALSAGGVKLRQKMLAAGLEGDLIELALELRRGYAEAVRTRRYMEPEEAERLQGMVMSEVVSLSARYAAGQLDVDGKGFHAMCLETVGAISAARAEAGNDRAAFLKGCMYDISDRCLLRFVKAAA